MPRELLTSLDFEALGTTCHIYGLGHTAKKLGAGAEWVASMHRRLSRFQPESELSRLNAGAGRWIAVSPELEAALREAQWAHEASRGLVHAGVLASMNAIGYTRPLKEGPTAARLEAARPLPPLDDMLEVAPGRARLAAGAGIDLGGIAKGWMADRLCERLAGNVLVNLGGDLRARGSGPRGEGWPVGLGEVTVTLTDSGAATSSVRKRRWEGTADGLTLHHLIDPRTGLPARTDLAEVSVVATTGARAEVVAKTALLLGSSLAAAFLPANALGWWLVPQ